MEVKVVNNRTIVSRKFVDRFSDKSFVFIRVSYFFFKEIKKEKDKKRELSELDRCICLKFVFFVT